MCPFHTPAFTLWLVMMDPRFISRDDSFQEVVTFSSAANQKSFADFQKFVLVQFCELLWDSSCTDFMEGKPVVDNFIG
jgi:hypothetical protein